MIAGLLPPLAGKGMEAFSNLERAGKFKDDGKTTTVKEAIVTTDANGHLFRVSLLAMMPRGSDYPDTPRPLC